MPKPIGACPGCGEKGPLNAYCERPACFEARHRMGPLPGASGNIEARAAQAAEQEEAERAAAQMELDAWSESGDKFHGVALDGGLQEGYDGVRERHIRVKRKTRWWLVAMALVALLVGGIGSLIPSSEQALIQACDGGDGPSCVAIGDALKGEAEIHAAAAVQYDRGCDHGALIGCYWSGRHYEAEGDLVRAEDRYALCCSESFTHPDGCFRLAEVTAKTKRLSKALRHPLYVVACDANHAAACLMAYRTKLPAAQGHAWLEKGCKAEHGEACAARARSAWAHHPLDPDAVKYAKRACQLGEAAMCSELVGREGLKGLSPGEKMKLAARGCKAKDAASCYLEGLLILESDQASQDKHRAVARFEKACARDYYPACIALADELYKRESSASSQARAQKLLEKTCEASHFAACVVLGDKFLAQNTKEGKRRALSLFGYACERGSHLGCVAIARDLRARASQFERIHRLATAACEAEVPEGCHLMGSLYAAGDTGMKNADKAEAHYRKACDARLGDACTDLGFYLHQQASHAGKDPRVAQLYERGCRLGSAMGCFNLGTLRQYGEGVVLSLTEAFTFYARACRGGHGMACMRVAEAYEWGKGVKKNPYRAREYRRKACKLGVPKACR